jgi:hypothetical protein
MLNAKDTKLGYAPDDNRLVQRFSWYSTSDPGFNGSLFTSIPQPGTNTPPFKISVMGQNFANYTAPIALVDSFKLAEFQVTPAAPPATSGPISYTLSVVVANAGNKVTPSQVKVRFFDPTGALIGATQTVTVQGCGSTVVASVVWPNVTPANVTGKKVKAVLYADPANPNAVTAEVSYTLLAATTYLYLPRIARAIP